jgi:hypothetical protein
MKRSIVFPLSIAAAFIIGCGGGGSSSTASTSVSGTVEASYLAGVKVCEANTTNCAITDAQGRFTLPGVSAPATLEVKVGNTVVGNVNATSNTVTVTPAVLADGNATVAAYIGATLHTIGGCPIGATDCNLSGVQDVVIDPNMADEPLVKVIATKLSAGDKNITCTVNNTTTVEVTDNNATLYQTINPDMSGLSTLTYHGINTESKTLFTVTLNTDTMQVTSSDLNLSDVLQPVYENFVFNLKNHPNQYIIANKNMFVTVIDDNNQTYFDAGLQYPDYNLTSALVSSVANKQYISISFGATSPEISIYDVNTTNDINGTWTQKDLTDGSTYTGTWEVNGTHFSFNYNGIISNVFLKPEAVRSIGIFYDSDGNLGFAMESIPLKPGEGDGTYYYVSSYCIGKVVINGNDITLYNEKCDNPQYQGTFNGTLVYNPDINGTVLNGVVEAKFNGGEDTYLGLISPEDGFFVALDLNDSQNAIVGTNEKAEIQK